MAGRPGGRRRAGFPGGKPDSAVVVEIGVTRVDASFAGQGAGAGNCPLEAIIGVADLMDWEHVYSSFLRHVEAAARRHGLDTRAILVEFGRRKMAGGQEDMITDIALDVAPAGSVA